MSKPDEPRGNVLNLVSSGFGRRRKGPFDWWHKLAFTKEGAVKPILHNLIVIFTHHEQWVDVFQFDEFSNRILLKRQPPCDGGVGELSEVGAGAVVAWLGNPENRFCISPKSVLVLEAVAVVAHRARFHPVRDYLTALRWDGESRLASLFSHYFAAEHSDYTSRCGVNWLVSAVARVMEPGCKVDFMIVLEGPQGLGKSRSIRELFGAPWFAEAMESPANKDFYQVLQGRWCVEISEMHSFSKADVTKVKQAITTQDDVYRPSYGRLAQRYPRHNIFVGSTNDEDYLRDPTGARRFLPIKCRAIEYDLLRQDRDQLWAEAFRLQQEGFKYWELPAQATEEQDDRYQEDSWTEPINRWLEGIAPPAYYPDGFSGRIKDTTITQLMSFALRIEVGKHTRQDQMRVGAVLRRLGWRRKRKRDGTLLKYVFERPPESPPERPP